VRVVTWTDHCSVSTKATELSGSCTRCNWVFLVISHEYTSQRQARGITSIRRPLLMHIPDSSSGCVVSLLENTLNGTALSVRIVSFPVACTRLSRSLCCGCAVQCPFSMRCLKWNCVVVLFILTITIVFTSGFNLNWKDAYVFQDPQSQVGSYFGFTVVLRHQGSTHW
jgi:hypothetical protein